MTAGNEQLEEASRAYERGDFKEARRLARLVLEQHDIGARQREAATRLLAATGIDPVAALVFAGTFVLLVFLIVRYVL